MRFIFVRHPQTVSNIEKRLTGVSDSPYTEEGERQAEAVIRYLSTASYDRIYSSPIERARYIGQSVADNLKARIEIAHWLKEINFGDYEGLGDEDFALRNINIDEHRKDLNFKFPNGDSWREFFDTRKKSVEELRKEEGVCLCTSHGGAIWTLSNVLLGTELSDFRGLFINNASIIIIDCDKDGGRIVKRIDIEEIIRDKDAVFTYSERK
jgi:broad specificity phosphatase PhoE